MVHVSEVTLANEGENWAIFGTCRRVEYFNDTFYRVGNFQIEENPFFDVRVPLISFHEFFSIDSPSGGTFVGIFYLLVIFTLLAHSTRDDR